MYQHNNSQKWLHLLRDPIWTCIFGVIATVLALGSLMVALVALPQTTPLRDAIAHSLLGAPPPTETPAPSPIPTLRLTPTPTSISPRVITEQLTLKCNDLACSVEPHLSIVLHTITIDVSHQTMSWDFTVTPGKDESYAHFWELQLQDSDPAVPSTAKATGPAIDQSWNVSAGQSASMRAVFSFVPQPQIRYRLQTNYNRLGFQDEFFTF